MNKVDCLKLQQCYELWHLAVSQKEKGESVSFHDGVVYAEEGYKYSILKMGREILQKIDWSDPQLVGSSKIAQIAMELLAICPSPGFQQNLVDYRDIMYFADQVYSQRLKDIEKALKLLFVDGNDKDAFNLLAHTLNKKYALISYFFFLKDSSKYQVVRPNNFAERFSMIGANGKCAINCSWENYQEYMSVLSEVKQFLAERHAEITLTDAHSFVWMLWMLSSK